MATFKICVFSHQKRKDGKTPVCIRVTWQQKSAFIKTGYYVTDSQLNKNNEIRDVFITNELNRRIEHYEKKKVNIGIEIDRYTAKQLADYFTAQNTHIDFLEFADKYCQQRKADGKSYQRIVSTINGLRDFAPKLPIENLTSKFLLSFEKHLKTKREITRNSQFGKSVTVYKNPISTHTIAGYMTDLRTVFNAAKFEYNDEDTGDIRIKHYPFRKYKIPSIPETKKRSITPEEINKIYQFSSDFYREQLARDVFILSFLFVGMNTADLFALKPDNYKNGRITYNRQKTRNRRKDKAEISIFVEPLAKELIEKYRDPKKIRLFTFHKRYTNSLDFVRGVNKGLKKVAAKCEINEKLSSYYARHSWATVASNDCNIDTDTIALCLNHVQDNKTTHIYIKKDWSKIDRANSEVISKIFVQHS
jgi:integrase